MGVSLCLVSSGLHDIFSMVGILLNGSWMTDPYIVIVVLVYSLGISEDYNDYSQTRHGVS